VQTKLFLIATAREYFSEIHHLVGTVGAHAEPLGAVIKLPRSKLQGQTPGSPFPLRWIPSRQRGGPEVGKYILEIGEHLLERPHLLIRHVLQREDDPFFTLSEGRDGMPEFVAVEEHDRPGVHGNPCLPDFLGLAMLPDAGH